MFHEDNEEPDEEAALRALELVARAFLDGAGDIIWKRGSSLPTACFELS